MENRRDLPEIWFGDPEKRKNGGLGSGTCPRHREKKQPTFFANKPSNNDCSERIFQLERRAVDQEKNADAFAPVG